MYCRFLFQSIWSVDGPSFFQRNFTNQVDQLNLASQSWKPPINYSIRKTKKIKDRNERPPACIKFFKMRMINLTGIKFSAIFSKPAKLPLATRFYWTTIDCTCPKILRLSITLVIRIWIIFKTLKHTTSKYISSLSSR